MLVWLATPASAQIPTGTITGRVIDAGALPTPGVTVALESPNLQGTRTTVTAQNGDYIFRLLPPGQYTITFTLSGFATTKESRDVAAAQTLTLDVTLKPASVAESITVSVDRPLFAPTVEASTNIKADVLNLLPSTRTLLGAVSPGAGRAFDRPVQRRLDRRRDVVRKPVHAQRRADPGQPARHAVLAVHRRRDPGDDDRHFRHLC
jgi:hypothetical protein